MFKSFIPKVFVKLRFERSTSFSSQVDVHDILIKHLGSHKKSVNWILKYHWNNVITIPKRQLILNCKLLEKLPETDDNAGYLLSCLQLKPLVVKHRIMLLEEFGVKNICSTHIFRFPGSMRGSITRFKKAYNIPYETSLMANILSALNLKTIPYKLSMGNATKMSDYYLACMEYYKIYHLKLSHTSLLKSCNIKYQSFREVTKILDILETRFQFSREFVSEHPHLIDICLDEITYFADEFANVKIGDMRMMELVKRNPRLLHTEVDNLKELLILLRKFSIPDKSIITYSNILKMNAEVFLHRYNHIISHPEVAIWSKHPRIVHLVTLYKKVMKRIRYLRLRKRSFSVNTHTLSSSPEFFMRYVNGLSSRIAIRKYLNYILCKELDLNNAHELVDYLSRHPHWRRIPLLSVANMLQFLRKRYSVQDICKNIQIVFYEQATIAETLEEVHKKYTAENGYNFTDSQYLALCLYKLEQINHFNGDAIWNMECNHDDPDDGFKASFEIDHDELHSLQ